MRRAIAMGLAGALWFAGVARAEVRVIDAATGASTTLLTDRGATVLRWADDGTGVLFRDGKGGIGRVGLDGTVTPQPQLPGSGYPGPGGRSVVARPDESGFELRAADGRVIAAEQTTAWGLDVAWTPDGGRVAVAAQERLVVLDTATGAVLLRRDVDARMTEQAFTPDGSALVFAEDDHVIRLELRSGAVTELYRVRGSGAALPAAVSTVGRVAVTRLGPVVMVGADPIRITGDPSKPVQWSPDGRSFAVTFLDYGPDRCSPYEWTGLAVFVPGQPRRVLLPAAERDVGTPSWSPDGTRIAVQVNRDWPPAERGKRRAWPKRITRDFKLPTAAQNAAARRVVVRASRALRAGRSREAVMNQVRREMTQVRRRFPAADDNPTTRVLVRELDRWLRAAGFKPTEGGIETFC